MNEAVSLKFGGGLGFEFPSFYEEGRVEGQDVPHTSFNGFGLSEC